jgi:hypothetical protein
VEHPQAGVLVDVQGMLNSEAVERQGLFSWQLLSVRTAKMFDSPDHVL